MQEDQSKISKPTDTQAEENENEDDGEDTPEKMEEMKLRAKFPQAAKGPPSAFLQKRLQQRKFFDSGDYNMAKAKGMKLPVGVAQKPVPPTAIHPKPQQDSLSVSTDDTGGSTSPTGIEIPTPGKIPARKTSIVQPTASKLSPQPLLHHSPTNPPTTTFENVAE